MDDIVEVAQRRRRVEMVVQVAAVARILAEHPQVVRQLQAGKAIMAAQVGELTQKAAAVAQVLLAVTRLPITAARVVRVRLRQ